MTSTEKQPVVVDVVRELARQGRLAQHFPAASLAERRRLRAAAFEIAWPLVFHRITRPVERKRGHRVCAVGMQRLAPDCLDHFHNDVDAVLDDLFAHADLPIDNLEGWLTMRMRRATVDGHRRRRGRRGAPQRPRVPNWLAEALGRDAWLIELATSILDWVGTEATAGTSLWPLTAWTERRALASRDYTAGESVVATEIEVVLATMRRRPTWYDKNVEQPLGRKQAPVHLPSPSSSGGYAEPQPLALVERHEKDDALLLELATQAIALIERRTDTGEDVHAVVADVLGVVFGALPASHDLDRCPGGDPAGPDQVVTLIGDPDRLSRITATVVELLRRRDRPSEG
ncbi:hypothetical protein E1091_07135 [Micromonospora fluostatini]|uniref:Uncharacterized protein n=1 Tax=Micromonospora fluostatini TaxID=1629071 RepID=A0ABY2DJ58_9ACTN|nr:hypothetical protein E1091_07135 [Micromonospora fluostatini]